MTASDRATLHVAHGVGAPAWRESVLLDGFYRYLEGEVSLPTQQDAESKLYASALRIEISGAFQEELYAEPESEQEDSSALIVTLIDDGVKKYFKKHLPDVDHFFPHLLKRQMGSSVDGVWNLVPACRACNRGAGGKFERAPALRLLARLHTRNEYLISSHHPLRETLIRQTGKTEALRRSFLNVDLLLHTWEPH